MNKVHITQQPVTRPGKIIAFSCPCYCEECSWAVPCYMCPLVSWGSTIWCGSYHPWHRISRTDARARLGTPRHWSEGHATCVCVKTSESRRDVGRMRTPLVAVARDDVATVSRAQHLPYRWARHVWCALPWPRRQSPMQGPVGASPLPLPVSGSRCCDGGHVSAGSLRFPAARSVGLREPLSSRRPHCPRHGPPTHRFHPAAAAEWRTCAAVPAAGRRKILRAEASVQLLRGH